MNNRNVGNEKNPINTILIILLVVQILVLGYFGYVIIVDTFVHKPNYCPIATCSDDTYTNCTAVDEVGNVIWTGSCKNDYNVTGGE